MSLTRPFRCSNCIYPICPRPTYPQVYAGGELVGGLDIIKELKESGDLESTLKGE